MPDTPFFPAWRARFGGPVARAVTQVRADTLCELEQCCGACVPVTLFPKAAAKANSRDRVYTGWRTFWCVIWQSLQPGASGREVVRQVQALFALRGGPAVSAGDGAYCKARARLPEPELVAALTATARAADRRVAPGPALQGRPLKALDGTTLTLADTPENRAEFPAVQSAPPNFPLARLVVLASLASGAVLAAAVGGLRRSELALSATLAHLLTGDIVVGDRGFGCYPFIAWLRGLGVDFIGRTRRKLDGCRATQRFGRDDWLQTWAKGPRPSPWLALAQWLGLPATLTVRVVRGRVSVKGFRVRQVVVITTLLDPALYPAEEILRAYLRRWRLEMSLDDLKTTLHLETLRNRSPALVRQEALTRLIAHNLVRWTMAQAAQAHAVPLERLSFKGTLDALRHFSQALSRAGTRRRREALWAELLRTLAADLVPERPGRREPRAVKRRKHKYPRLNTPRARFLDHPKRHVRRARAHRRARGKNSPGLK